MAEAQRTFLPAAGHEWFLPLYDPLTKLLGVDRARRALLDQAAIRPRDRVLEIGCGPGGLIALIRSSFPEVAVFGLDPDPKALARARRKTGRDGAAVQLDQGFSDELPYSDASFDRVFSSFMFHHLGSDEKEKTLREARRVLKPEGSFHLVDLAAPESSAHGFFTHLLHSSERLRDNAESRILGMMRSAGFTDAKKVGERALLLGRVAYYRASMPRSEIRGAG
jgi:ubiquinone/menaquinone biosynthesis C-methylase UbiE